MGPDAQPVPEEHEDNLATGIETEESDEFHDIDRPWNPESIRVATKSFSLRNMLDSIDEDSLDLAPDFQRLKVWKPVQKAQLIESILLQIPLPAFYFAEDTDGTLRVVDGVQRLTTIYDFVRGGADGRSNFSLAGLEYIADVEGLRFEDLPRLWQRRIYNTQITANVIDPTTPRPVMYDIFRRINTGGTPLNAQEIRHCMSRARSREFLKGLVETPLFNTVTGGALQKQRRMIDREVALRFTAFWLLGVDEYEPPMDEFLWSATELLDDSQPEEPTILETREAFQCGLSRADQVFGRHAFRKWPDWDDVLRPFNRALFESWTVELARLPADLTVEEADKLRIATRAAMTRNYQYIDSVSASTGDRNRVRNRFKIARQLIEQAQS